MVKYSIILVNALFAVVLAQRQQQVADNKYKSIPIVSQTNQHDFDGTFKYNFEDGVGTRVEQSGNLKYVDQQNAGEAVQGGFSYTVRQHCINK